MSWPFTLSRVNNLIRNVKRNNINKSPSVSFDVLRVFYIDTEKISSKATEIRSFSSSFHD